MSPNAQWGPLVGQKIAGMGSVGCLCVIYTILVNISWNRCEKKAGPGLWWWISFFFGRSRKNQEVIADTKWVSVMYEARYHSWLNDGMRINPLRTVNTTHLRGFFDNEMSHSLYCATMNNLQNDMLHICSSSNGESMKIVHSQNKRGPMWLWITPKHQPNSGKRAESKSQKSKQKRWGEKLHWIFEYRTSMKIT